MKEFYEKMFNIEEFEQYKEEFSSIMLELPSEFKEFLSPEMQKLITKNEN